MIEEGDIILFGFLRTDLEGGKLRPALLPQSRYFLPSSQLRLLYQVPVLRAA